MASLTPRTEEALRSLDPERDFWWLAHFCLNMERELWAYREVAREQAVQIQELTGYKKPT